MRKSPPPQLEPRGSVLFLFKIRFRQIGTILFLYYKKGPLAGLLSENLLMQLPLGSPIVIVYTGGAALDFTLFLLFCKAWDID